MFSIVPVLDDLISHPTHHSRSYGVSPFSFLMDDLKSQLGTVNAVKTLKDDKDHLTLGVNCENFKPEEIKVSIKDNYITIEGSHESKDEHNYVKRQFSRRYQLPANANQKGMKCSLNQSGVLKIDIPKNPEAIKDAPVNIPIQFSK